VWTNVADTFSRANGPIGSAETGQVWATANSGSSFTVSGNQAAPVYNSGALHTPCTVDSGVSDCTVTCDFISAVSGTGFIWRLSDDSNYWLFLVADGAVYKKVAGTFAGVANPTAASGTWTVQLSGSSIVLTSPSAVQTNITDSFNSTATRHGFSSFNTNTQRYDNFFVRTPSTAPSQIRSFALRRSTLY